MTGNSDLPARLRKLASHRAGILGVIPEDMEEWQAADEIEALKQQLSLARQRKEHARREVNRAMDKMMEDGK